MTVFALCAGFGQFNAGVADRRDPASRVPLQQTSAGLLVVPVTLNASGTYPFLLDTGSETTLIDPTLADDAGLDTAGRTDLVTSTGVIGVTVSRASLLFGAVEARDLEVLQLPLDAVRTYAPGVRGVIGHDVLRRSNWLLDYDRAVLVQDIDADSLRCGHRLPVHWIGGRVVVDATFGGTKTNLVLDSAARRTLLFARPGDRFDVVEAREQISIRSFSGEQRVPAITIESLRFGSLAVPQVTAAVLSDAVTREEGGIVPTALFGTLYFDYRTDSVFVTARSADRSGPPAYPEACRSSDR
jgi:hypothetical protein